jgi:hypothetical protein
LMERGVPPAVEYVTVIRAASVEARVAGCLRMQSASSRACIPPTCGRQETMDALDGSRLPIVLNLNRATRGIHMNLRHAGDVAQSSGERRLQDDRHPAQFHDGQRRLPGTRSASRITLLEQRRN